MVPAAARIASSCSGLICAIEASSSIRTGSEKRSRKLWMALITRCAWLFAGHLGDLTAMRPGQEPIADLAHDHWMECRDPLGRVEQADQTKRAIRQRAFEGCHEDATTNVPSRLWRRVQLLHDTAHDCQVKFDKDVEKRLAWTGLSDPADRGHLDTDLHGLPCSVLESFVAERRPLGALRHDTNGRLGDHVGRRLLVVRPENGQPFDRRCERALPNLSISVAPDCFHQLTILPDGSRPS